MKTKKRIGFAGVLLLALLCNQASAQTSGGLGFFAPGIHTIGFSKLNSWLPAGYPEIVNRPFVTAGKGYGIVSNFMIGGEGGSLHTGSFTKNNQVVDLSGSVAYFSIGYLVVNKKGLLVYPMISIGNNEMEMFIHEKDRTTPFPAVTSEPFQSATLKYRRGMLKVAAAATYVLKGNRSESGAGGLMVGLEAGYQMGYKNGTWSYDNGVISDGPNFCTNAFFLQLLIGGGGVAKKSR